MNTRSIYFRLILWYSGMVTVVFLSFGTFTYQGIKESLYSRIEHTFSHRAHRISENILIHIHEKTPQEIAGQIKEIYSPAANNWFMRILRSDRSVLYISDLPKDRRFDPAAIPLPPHFTDMQRMEPLPGGLSLLVISFPVQSAGESFLIEEGAITDETNLVLDGLVTILLGGLSVVIFVVSAGGYILLRRALKPVEDIRAKAEQITFGNLRNRLPVVQTGDALEHLSITLNQMLERLEDAYQQLSRFSADASHELRTPLTIMRGELESMLRQEPALHEHLYDSIASILEEVERLSRITESLFTISRLDAQEAKMDYVTFYLGDLVETTTDQMLLLAEEKSITITVTTAQPAKVKGDAARLKQVVVNLLDNAIKYTPLNGSITITTGIEEHKAVMTFAETGIGIPADDLPHIFERFYRADKGRSREQGGAGLGLSIVRAICQAHGGTIDIESTEHKGTICRVELPLANGKEA